jgi:hypothetical protein
MSDPKSYVCGVCKGTFEGSPKGGFNTRSGEVLCCSGECATRALATREDIISAGEMLRLQSTN